MFKSDFKYLETIFCSQALVNETVYFLECTLPSFKYLYRNEIAII